MYTSIFGYFGGDSLPYIKLGVGLDYIFFECIVGDIASPISHIEFAFILK